MTTLHEWKAIVTIPVEVIRNEDDQFLFKVAGDATDMINSFSVKNAGCHKCGKFLEEVFGEPCTVE